MPGAKSVPKISVPSVGSIISWDFIWWVYDDEVVQKRPDPAKIWLCLVNDGEGMVFIRINSRKYEEGCYQLDDRYNSTHKIAGGYVRCWGDPIEISKERVSEIRHAYNKPLFFKETILQEDRVEISRRIENSLWMPREIKDRMT